MKKLIPARPRRLTGTLIGSLASLALLAGWSSGALATPYVDQVNSILPTGNFSAIFNGTTAAQTFAVGFSGTLAEVRVVVDPRGTPVANLTLEVQGTTAGVPDGVALATASVAPFGGTNPLVVFDVSAANLNVTAGQLLAFVLKSTAVAGNDYLARAVPSNRYGAGEFTNSLGSIPSGSGWDAIFKTVVTPASLPGAGASDQLNSQTPTGNFAAIFLGNTAAQTFTVGTAGVLTRIDVMIDPRNTPVVDLLLDVQTTSGGLPTGTVVASASLAPFGGTNPIVSFDLSPYNLAVTQGEVLAFVLRCHAAGGTDYLARAVPGNTYAGGQFTNSSGGFANGGGWDAIFETFVYVSPPVGVEPARDAGAIAGLELAPCSPNPVARGATIGFRLPAAGLVRLGIYDVSGRLVSTVVDGYLGAGAHETRWDREADGGGRVAPGVYFSRLVAGNEARSSRIVVVE